jgi:hypothetical protein
MRPRVTGTLHRHSLARSEVARIVHHTGRVLRDQRVLERQRSSTIQGQSYEIWGDEDLPPNKDRLMWSGAGALLNIGRNSRDLMQQERACSLKLWWQRPSNIQAQSREMWHDKDFPSYRDISWDLMWQGLSNIQDRLLISGETEQTHETWWDRSPPQYRDSLTICEVAKTFHHTGKYRFRVAGTLTEQWQSHEIWVTWTLHHTRTVSRDQADKLSQPYRDNLVRSEVTR